MANCPIPINQTDHILLGHGSGGKLTHQLIKNVFYSAFANPLLAQDHDGCVFDVEAGKMAYTTDSYVVDPIFFPGGNIGDLAINGTINDLACCGAKPLYLTCGFILEEGLLIDDLKKIVHSMKLAADKAGVKIVAGDTKVVERGKCDKIFINTSGVGVLPKGVHISPANAQVGDVVICSGNIGVHGITILSTRESLGFETTLESDSASLNTMIEEILAETKKVHVLRDPTRGGVSGTLDEIAKTAKVSIELEESLLPIPNAVRAASEILGLDPLYIANEGIVLLILPENEADKVLKIMHKHAEGKNATIIGKVVSSEKAIVTLKNAYGTSRIINTLNGDQLPRIC